MQVQPGTILADIMTKKVWSAFADTTLEEVSHHFDDVTGVPVVDKGLVCIGVLSKKDLTKAHGDVSIASSLKVL